MKNIRPIPSYIKIVLFLEILLLYSTNSQGITENPVHLGSIIENAEKVHNRIYSDPSDTHDVNNDKCGLWLSFEIVNNWDAFSAQQKVYLRKLLSPKQTQKDTIIGYFHIFYDTSGVHEPALLNELSERIPGTARDYVDSVGYYLNYTWRYFIDSLDYTPPPFQTGESYYKIFIEEISDPYQYYGETVFTQDDLYGNFDPPRYTSYIRIDNDFQNLRSEGIAGLKVTCAHELHHAFQLGSYGYLGNDIYIYEITSTWMEDVLYDDINDYYQYIKTSTDSARGHFYYPDVAFTSNLSKVTYSRAIWGKFIEKRFSSEVMRQTWEFIRAGEKCLIAIDHSLTLYGSNFRKAFLEWALWNNNTGPSCDTIQYYSEGRQYPQIRLRTLVEYIDTYRSFSDSIEALSSVYHPICLLDSPTDDCNTSPQMMAIISNVNENGVNDVRYGFTYELSPTEVTGYTLLSNGIYVRLNAPDPENWVSQEDVPSIVSDIVVFPNPFYSGESKQLIFRFPPCSDIKATLYIFSSSMDKIISKDFDIISQGNEPKIIWDGSDMHGRIIPTGIYFYVIAIDGKEYMGKISVIRE